MAKRIVIDPVTRIEGHARISIYVNEAGEVEAAQFHVGEFRGFEKFAQGRPFHEMPGLMARTCGICPVSHVLAGSRAGDMLLGLDPPPAARAQRRLLNYAQHLQSHALSFFYLSCPDLLLGFDSPPERRHILGLAEADPGFVRRGVRLRQFGQTIIETIGGRRVHPPGSVPGGMTRPLEREEVERIRQWLPEALESVQMALDRFKALLGQFQEEIASLGDFPSLFMGMVNGQGELEIYDGAIRFVDAAGNIVADNLDPARYFTYIGEASEEWSYMKFPYYRPLGYPGGMYRVGPLARLNVCTRVGTPLADRELREFRQRAGRPACATFHYHWARLIEMLHAVERIDEITADDVLLDPRVRARAGQNANVGIGACEAPRGTLFHHYEVDDTGLVRRANLLIATGQNNLAMNQAVTQAAKRFVRTDQPAESGLNRVEAAIRCFDPCLSCATHAFGRIPLLVEFRRRDGSLLRRLPA
ncbi:MAG: Ni/Fe hydrogenase subunit alpha [Bryobacteraceae bacterium]|nr:Ni/Fe hydrogenase subunit alpha [Bryobacteraceae bacterium]